MTDDLKMKILRNLVTAQSKAQNALIFGDTEQQCEAMVLLDALRLYNRGCLGGVLPALEKSNENDFRACDVLVAEITFSGRVTEHIRRTGVRYVGECFYIDLRGLPGEELRHDIAARTGLPPYADPVALGWKPWYWGDAAIMRELETPLGGAWDGRHWWWNQYWNDKSVAICKPRFVGEGLIAMRGNGVLWRYGGLETWDNYFRWFNERANRGAELWPTIIFPPGWRAPDWREYEPWKTEYEAQKLKIEAMLQDETVDISCEELEIMDLDWWEGSNEEDLRRCSMRTLRELLSVTSGKFARIPLGHGGSLKRARVRARLAEFGLEIGMLSKK